MGDEFQKIVALKQTIMESTHELKDRLSGMHKRAGINERLRLINAMGISELVNHVNELETASRLLGGSSDDSFRVPVVDSKQTGCEKCREADYVRRELCKLLAPRITSGSWEDIWENVRTLVRHA